MSQEEFDEFANEVNELLDSAEQCLVAVDSGESLAEHYDEIFRVYHNIKGISGMLEMQDLQTFVHQIETLFTEYKGKVSLTKEESNFFLGSIDGLRNLAFNKPFDFTSYLEKFHEKPQITDSEQYIEEITPESSDPTDTQEDLMKNVVAKEQEVQESSSTQALQNSHVRVSVNLLDRLMTMIGEMVLVRNQVLQHAKEKEDYEFSNLSQRLDVVTSELQEEMMKTRMQPIEKILKVFHRTTRDLAQQMDKKIELKLSGTETELDRSLLESIKDPLTHIVRNSCDHGLEGPEERKLKGKPEVGTIHIKAYHEGGQVIIEVSDDGRGVDIERVKQKALENKIIDASRLDKITEDEICNLIFQPGFSTAKEVSNISGRGVGMDIVKTNIEKIGGGLSLESQFGLGMNIKINIPLTLAIVPALVISCDQLRYAIPQVRLMELVRVSKNNDSNRIEMLQNQPVMVLRGELVPLVLFKEVLEIPGQQSEVENIFEQDQVQIVVLKNGSSRFGLVVDDVLDTVDIVVKPLSKALGQLSIYSGTTVLGDGSVATILDVGGVAKSVNLRADEKECHLHESVETQTFEQKEDLLKFHVSSHSIYAIPLSRVKRLEEFHLDKVETSGLDKVVQYRGGVLNLYDMNLILGFDESIGSENPLKVIVVNTDSGNVGLVVSRIDDIISIEKSRESSKNSNPLLSEVIPTSAGVVTLVDLDAILEKQYGIRSVKSLVNKSLDSLSKVPELELSSNEERKVS